MKILEVVASPLLDSSKLLQLAQFLRGRALDTGAELEISKKAFISRAQDYGVNIDADQLVTLADSEPLNAVLMPVAPNSDIIQFKGAEPESVAMPVDNAQDIVANAAKSAMKKDRSV
jgi:hypothetical protein